MDTFQLNDEISSNNIDNIDNIDWHLYELFKEKKNEIESQYPIQEFEIKDISSKDNNDIYSTNIFQDTQKFSNESINPYINDTEPNNKIFLNKKTNPDKIDDENNDNYFKAGNIKEKEIVNLTKNIKRSSRIKDDKNNSKQKNYKFREDNIIKKIKNAVFKYILQHLNKSLKYEIYNFYPLSQELTVNIRKDFNEKLLDRTIHDIYENSDMGRRYINVPDLNRELIRKIYKEKIETETIIILDKTFRDILEDIRKKDLNNFLDDFRNKEINKNKKSVDEYMKKVKSMLFKYEFWFKAKTVKNRRKK